LDGELRVTWSGILDIRIEVVIRSDVLEVVILIACVHAQQIVRVRNLMNEQVVHESAALGHQARVVRLSNNQFCRVIAAHLLDEMEGLRTSDFDFAHVTYIKQSGTSANRFVLSENARIFERHLPSAEVNHFCAQTPMKRIQSCFAQFSSGRCCHRGFLIAETRKST